MTWSNLTLDGCKVYPTGGALKLTIRPKERRYLFPGTMDRNSDTSTNWRMLVGDAYSSYSRSEGLAPNPNLQDGTTLVTFYHMRNISPRYVTASSWNQYRAFDEPPCLSVTWYCWASAPTRLGRAYQSPLPSCNWRATSRLAMIDPWCMMTPWSEVSRSCANDKHLIKLCQWQAEPSLLSAFLFLSLVLPTKNRRSSIY